MKYVVFFFYTIFYIFFRNFSQSLEISLNTASSPDHCSCVTVQFYTLLLQTQWLVQAEGVFGHLYNECFICRTFFPQTSLLNTTKSPSLLWLPTSRWWSGGKRPVFHLGYENFNMPGSKFSASYRTWARLVSFFLGKECLFLFIQNGVFSSTLTIKHCGLSWQTWELIAPIPTLETYVSGVGSQNLQLHVLQTKAQCSELWFPVGWPPTLANEILAQSSGQYSVPAGVMVPKYWVSRRAVPNNE